jgi:Fe-S-cluster containining protein
MAALRCLAGFMRENIAINWIVDEDRLFADMPIPPQIPVPRVAPAAPSSACPSIAVNSATAPAAVVPVELTSKVNDTIACMKGTESGHGRCIALVGELGRPGIACSIYARRPSTCGFSAWDADGQPNPTCQRLRTGLGLPSLAPCRLSRPHPAR